jgi:Ca2+/H+ antiporter
VVVTIIALMLMLIAVPFVVDRNSMSQLSPAIFLATVAVIILLAWYINKTVYRTVTRHMQRDIVKEHVSVANAQPPQTTAPSGGEEPPESKTVMMIEGKEE